MILPDSHGFVIPELYLLLARPLAKLCLKRAQQASTAHFQLLMQAGNPVEIELTIRK